MPLPSKQWRPLTAASAQFDLWGRNMLGYILALQRQQAQADLAKCGAVKPQPAVKAVPPLTDQIRELMNGLPAAVRARPWAILDIVNRLEGRYRQRPHAQGVGQALRRLGWVRTRPEGASGQSARLWVPPDLVQPIRN